MNKSIHADMRVLYKKNGQWNVGTLQEGKALINDRGLFLPIVDEESEVVFTDIFFDAFEIDPYIKDYKEYFMTKEEYIEYIQGDDFDRHHENAYVSDGEYGYYPVSCYTKNWLEKQPFDYIVRYDY